MTDFLLFSRTKNYFFLAGSRFANFIIHIKMFSRKNVLPYAINKKIPTYYILLTINALFLPEGIFNISTGSFSYRLY